MVLRLNREKMEVWFKGDIQRVLMQKFLCQVLGFAHSARIYLQIHIQKQNTAQTGKLQWCCHILLWLLQRNQPLCATSAVQVDEASCVLLKTDLFSFQVLSDNIYTKSWVNTGRHGGSRVGRTL